jgi:hypothetical protein
MTVKMLSISAWMVPDGNSRARTLSPHSCTNPDNSIPAPGGLKRRYLPLGTFLSAWTRIDDDHPCLAMDRDRFELPG